MRKKAKFLVANLVLFLLAATLCNAQSSVRGKVVDSIGHPLYGASVLLHNSKDSSLAKGSMTAQNGTYVFEKISAGSYFIASSYAGFKDAYSSVFQVNRDGVIAIAALNILEKVLNLASVTVTARKAHV